MPPDVEFRLLGPVELLVGGEPRDLGTAKQRCVLAVLLLAPGGQVSTEALVDRVWGDAPPAQARSTLYSYLTRLRKALGGTGVDIRRRSGGYLLDVPPDRVDVLLAASLVAQAQEEPRRRAELAGRVLELWRGEPLSGLPGTWAERVRARLRRQRLDLLTAWAGALLAEGAAGEVVDRLRPEVAANPLAEALIAQYLRALHASGRTGEALDHYHDATRRLGEELGAEPGHALVEAYHHISVGQVAASGALVPAQLPAAPTGFLGRNEQLARLDDLATASGIILVTGAPGVGKTALAIAWGHRAAARFPDGQLYVDLRGHADAEPVRPIDALSKALRSLGVSSKEIPFDEGAGTGLYRSLLAQRNVLVVLDNAHSVDQVRPLLPGSHGSVVVITSRQSLSGLLVEEGARRVRLAPLRQDDAVDLLGGSLAPDRMTAEPAAARELAQVCGCLPLALRIAVANLLDDPTRTIADYVRELRAETPLAALETDDADAAVRAAFDLSYQRLDGEQRRVFRLLALHPGAEAGLGAAAALAGMPVRRLLDRLVSANLLEASGHARYSCHDLLNQYARERVLTEERADERASALRRLAGYYLRSADAATRLGAPAVLSIELPSLPAGHVETFATEQEALTWLDTEHGNLVTLGEAAEGLGLPEVAWLLAGVMRGYFQARTYHYQWRRLADAGVAAANRHGDAKATVIAQLSAGYLHRYRQNVEEAIQALEAVVEAARQAAWPLAEATALTQLGLTYPKVNGWQDAVDSLSRAAEIARAEGDPAIEGVACGNLGLLYAHYGYPRRALPHLRRELDLLAVSPSKFREANALLDMGLALGQLGRYPAAVTHHSRALALTEELGHGYLETFARVNLATAYLGQDRFEEAEEQARLAFDVARGLHVSMLEALALSAQAAIEDRLGRTAQALGHHQRALKAAEKSGNHRALTEVATRLAEHTVQLSDADTAVQLARSHGFRIHEARALRVAAEAHLAAGNRTEAARHAQASLELCQEIELHSDERLARQTLAKIAESE